MTVHGYDVSHFQAPLTPASVAHAVSTGRRFAGIKLSEGTYQTDPHFAANRNALRTHAVPRWLYHEMRPLDDVVGSVQQTAAHQLDRIMAASGGFLYPRERLVLVLGDFAVGAAGADALRDLLQRQGPVKAHGGHHRPDVIFYANRGNWRTVYSGLAGPRIVAAFPGPAEVDCVIHQDSNHDAVTGGDHDVWIGGQGAGGGTFEDCERFFLR